MARTMQTNAELIADVRRLIGDATTITRACVGNSAVAHAHDPEVAAAARQLVEAAGYLTADSYGPEAFAVLPKLLPAAEAMPARAVFVTDWNGRYELAAGAGPEGEHLAHATGTRTTYRSHAHRLTVTGTTDRRHTLPGPVHRTVVYGRRAVLTLDTGEGLSTLPGVLLPAA